MTNIDDYVSGHEDEQMTVQEAIQTIQKMLEVNKSEHRTLMEHQVTALDMAIEALSCSEEPNRSEPKIADSGSNSTDIARNTQNEPENGDLIRRQDAIDALEEQLDYLQMLNKDENPTAESKWYGVNWARNTIADLPSAQPKTAIRNAYKHGKSKGIKKGMAMSAQPRIIRCKDCKYFKDTGDDFMCDNEKGWVVATSSVFGCILAERKDNE